MRVVIDRNCFEEADASSSDDGMAHGRLEWQSMLVLVPGGGFYGEVLSPLDLLVSDQGAYRNRKISSPLFPFSTTGR